MLRIAALFFLAASVAFGLRWVGADEAQRRLDGLDRFAGRTSEPSKPGWNLRAIYGRLAALSFVVGALLITLSFLLDV